MANVNKQLMMNVNKQLITIVNKQLIMNVNKQLTIEVLVALNPWVAAPFPLLLAIPIILEPMGGPLVSALKVLQKQILKNAVSVDLW